MHNVTEPTFIVPPLFPALGVKARVIDAASRLSGHKPRRIVSDDRTRELAQLRWGIMVAFRHRGFTLPQIGGLLGRDHTTVMHGLKRADELRQTLPGFDEYCRALIAVVDGKGCA